MTDPALIAACKRSLAVRGDDSAGWSSAWKICLWAGLGDGERALALCNQLVRYTVSEGSGWHGGTHPNLLCTCPPFQIDANFGFVAAVNEMLVQERNGEVVLLPALPALWKNGKVKGLRVGGKTVNIEWRDGKITSADVIPESI